MPPLRVDRNKRIKLGNMPRLPYGKIVVGQGENSDPVLEDKSTGAQGPPGAPGAKGDKGDKGDQGIQGYQGNPGAKGDPGEQGPQGIQGEPGSDADVTERESSYNHSQFQTAYTHSQAAHAPSNAQANTDITKAEIEAKLTGSISSHSHAGGGGDVVYIATPANFAINSTSDVTIVTRDVTGVAANDQLIVEATFLIMNNSTATRVYVITTDFDEAFDVEHSTGACAFSTTLWHPFQVRAVLNVRASNLAYATMVTEGQLAAGVASGGDTTMAATHLRAMGWGSTTSDLTGTTTVALKVRSANATATQTLYLLSLTIRKVTPT